MAYEDEGDIAKAMGVDNGPSLYLNNKQYPDIGKLDIGEEVTWTIKGIVQSIDASNYGNKPRASASINITEIDGKKSTVPYKKHTEDSLVESDD